MRRLLVATTNKGKLTEIREIMTDFQYEIICFDDALRLGLLDKVPSVVEDGASFKQNALKKACEISKLVPPGETAVLADDSGLEIDFLNGGPGVDSAYFMGAEASYAQRNARIIDLMRNVNEAERSARFVSVIALSYPNGRVLTARGVCEGLIAAEPAGDGGFGYDPIFFVPDFGKTFAQLSPQEKNAVSHRSVALRKIKELIAKAETPL